METETDFLIRITNPVQAIATFKRLGIDMLLSRNEKGEVQIDSVFGDRAVKFFPRFVTKRAVIDNSDPLNPVVVEPAEFVTDVMMIRTRPGNLRRLIRAALWEREPDRTDPDNPKLVRKTIPNAGFELIDNPGTHVWL